MRGPNLADTAAADQSSSLASAWPKPGLLWYTFPPFTSSKMKEKHQKRLRKLAMKMFRGGSSQPDGDFRLDDTSIHR